MRFKLIRTIDATNIDLDTLFDKKYRLSILQIILKTKNMRKSLFYIAKSSLFLNGSVFDGDQFDFFVDTTLTAN